MGPNCEAFNVRPGAPASNDVGKHRAHEGDARRFRLPSASFDCVAILGNSFGYFEQESQDLDVLASAARVLCPEGQLVLDRFLLKLRKPAG